MTNYTVGRLWAAAPAGVRFKSAALPSGILLCVPFVLTENLALTALELLQTSPGEQHGSVKVALYAEINGLPSGAALVAADIVVKPNSRAIWQAPVVDGAPVPVALSAGSYFVLSMTIGNLTMAAIDPESAEIEAVLGRASLADPRPVSALTPLVNALPIPITQLPRMFDGTETWADWHGPVPLAYLAS